MKTKQSAKKNEQVVVTPVIGSQRPIKIRFWYTNGHEFQFKVFSLEEIMNGAPFDWLCDNPLLKTWRMCLERDEWSGILDQAGTEIFENDFTDFGGVGIVSYDEDRFFVDCYSSRTRVSKMSKVIGNKMQNPEFLPF